MKLYKLIISSNQTILRAVQNILKGALRSFGEEIPTQNLYNFRINEAIIKFL